MGYLDTAGCCRTTHTLIGTLACVATIGASRVYLYPITHTTTKDKLLHNSLGGRRTAYITQAYKEYALLHSLEYFDFGTKIDIFGE